MDQLDSLSLSLYGRTWTARGERLACLSTRRLSRAISCGVGGKSRNFQASKKIREPKEQENIGESKEGTDESDEEPPPEPEEEEEEEPDELEEEERVLA